MADKEVNRQQPEELEIVVDDGSRRICIKNLLGDEIGVFCFRPTDIGIIQRYNEVAEKVGDIIAPLVDVNITEEGTAEPDDSAGQAVIDEAKRRLFEACDYMFDGNMSAAFFGKMEPFSPINGSFYFENALEKVGKFINAQFEAETKKIDARLGKYVGQYAVGKGKGRGKK